MQVELAYGRSGLLVDLPDDRTTVIEPEYVPGLPEEGLALAEALQAPIDGAPLSSLVRAGQKVAISVCDITRAMPRRRVLKALLAMIRHVPPRDIVVLVATGTHRPNTPAELEHMLGQEILDRHEVINHSAFDAEDLVRRGKTSDGIPIWLNRRWMEADFRITTGFVEPHFFAGFSGGPKMVAPGLAGFETIIRLHGARLIADPGATWGKIDGNPIHEAIREIARLTGVNFSVDVTLNSDHQITGIYAGRLEAAHRAACEFARRTAMRPISQPFEIVITTNSGYPLDLNLYQAVKGMSAAARVVRPGGTILCAAECSDGIPEHGEYRRILASAESPEELLRMIHAPGYERHDQWQVQLQAQIQRKAKVLLKSSFLTPEQVRAAHLVPVDNIEGAVSEELARFGLDARVCVLPQGPQTIPYIESCGNLA